MEIMSHVITVARTAMVPGVAALGVVLGASGTAHAAVDDQIRIVSDGLEVVVTQEDTFIQGVPALGGSPFNREWFHNGRATVTLIGEKATGVEDTAFQVGYQFAWSGSVDGSVGVTYSTPGLEVAVSSDPTLTVTDILPQAHAEITLTPSPGIEELVVAEGEFDGDSKHIQLANIHGTASGVVGTVHVRPFVRAITANGDNVTTYGKSWTV